MDPKEAYKRALAFEPGAAQDLIEWLERGGALPVQDTGIHPGMPAGFDMRATFISALRKLGKIADEMEAS